MSTNKYDIKLQKLEAEKNTRDKVDLLNRENNMYVK